MLVEPVRRRFQRQMRDALARQPVEKLRQRHRVGRGQRAVNRLRRRDQPDGSDACGAFSERGPDLARERRDRGLAAGAGHRRDDTGLARIKSCGGKRERGAYVAGTHESDIRGQIVRRALRHDRGGARGERLRHKAKAVLLRAGHGHEQTAALHLAAVRRDAGDVERGKARIDRAVLTDQIAEFHEARSIRAGYYRRADSAAITAPPASSRSAGAAGPPAAGRSADPGPASARCG